MFDNDVFISYSHKDNRPMPIKKHRYRWVKFFQDALEWKNANLKIWRDPKIRKNEDFDEKIKKQLDKSAIMISIFSPYFLESECCRKELEHFFTKAAKESGVRIDDKSRILKIVKSLAPHEDHPPELAKDLGYDFLWEDENGTKREFLPGLKDELDFDFFMKIEDVNTDIKILLEKLTCQQNRKAIYLAHTSPELTKQRDSIKRELRHLGY